MWNQLLYTTLGGITVSNVLEMLWNAYLPTLKMLPLAIIEVVDNVVACSKKFLNLTPRYVEMLYDLQYFMEFPWGTKSFLKTLLHFLPLWLSKDITNPFEEMCVRLALKTTTCYGFTLAL